jgi:hypothetical protein
MAMRKNKQVHREVTLTCPHCHSARVVSWRNDLPLGWKSAETACEYICRPCSAKQYCQRESWQKAHRGPANLTAEQRAVKSANAKRQLADQGGVPNAVKFTKGSTAGDKNHRWRGGITPEIVRQRIGSEGRAWSRAVMERDNYTCQICFKRGGKLHAHHIKKFSEFSALRLSIDNGVTACADFHLEIIHRGNNSGPSMSIEEINWFRTAPVSIDWEKAA